MGQTCIVARFTFNWSCSGKRITSTEVVGNWPGPGCDVKAHLKKGFFGLPGSGRGSDRGSPSVTLKTFMIRPSNLHSQINLIITFKKHGKRLGGEVGNRYCYLS